MQFSVFSLEVLFGQRNINRKSSQNGKYLLSLFKLTSLRVIAKKVLRDFWNKYPICEQQLKSWFQEAEEANWKTPGDVKREYPSASIIADNRIVFNIKGNQFRLVVKANYAYGMLWIRFIGTHQQYDKIDVSKV